MEPTAGAQINPRVRLIEPVADGGMASVWAAQHAEINGRVAVKLLSAALLKRDPSLLERIEREATIAQKIGSEHAVRTYEQGTTDDGTPYIVMELLAGIDLGRSVLATGSLELAEVAHIVRQVAAVLVKARDIGVVHRDIKPDNIFLVDGAGLPFVKVLDFGIAKDGLAVNTLTQVGAIIGTPEFMAPEQAFNSKNVDHRADLFGLGMVAYFALTSELPYPPSDPLPHWLLQHRQPIPITQKRPDLPAALDDWFTRALALMPDKRFQTAEQMVEALDAIASGLATQPTDPPEPILSDDPPTSVVHNVRPSWPASEE